MLWCDSGAGFTLTRVIQALSRAGQNIPVIELREPISERDRVEALRAGAKDVVLKSNGVHLALAVERELSSLSHFRQRLRIQRRYADSQRTCLELLQSSKNSVAFVRDGRHIYANPSYRQLFGYSYLTELKGLPLKDLVSGADAQRVDELLSELARSVGSSKIEVSAVGSGGSESRVSLSFSRASINGEDAYRIIARDLNQRREPERQISRFDQLTGSLNQQHFMQRLESKVSAIQDQGGQGVLMLIELEHFRSIREAVGIAGSDLVIQELAKLVRDLADRPHCLARFADHTFTLYVPDSEVESVWGLAEKVRAGVESHISDSAGRSVSASCSIGLVAITRMTSDAQTALTQADIACRDAIHRGGNALHVYDTAEYATVSEEQRSSLSGPEVQEAMDEQRVALEFQPIISLHGRMSEVYQVEAELSDEFGNLVSHDTLLASAAKAGIAAQLDRWIVQTMLLLLAQGGGPGPGAHLFVRLSDQSVTDADLISHLEQLLRQSGVDGHRLVLEVSKAVATGQVRYAQEFVKALKRLGCMAALARFGAGSNSFRSLKHLDVDFLKIDETVMTNLVENTANQNAVRSIQELARLNNQSTIATLVQDADSLALLWQLGVNYVQGDYILSPIIELGPVDLETAPAQAGEPGPLH